MKDIRSKYRFLSWLLAAMVLLSSVGFTVDLHYCGGHLKSYSLVGKARKCHEMESSPKIVGKTCAHHSGPSSKGEVCTDEKGCCSNKTLHFQTDNDQQLQLQEGLQTPSFQKLFTAYVSIPFHSSPAVDYAESAMDRYRPPLIHRDILVLNQSFLL